MNTDISEIERDSAEPDAGDEERRERSRRGGGAALAVLALLLALAALAGSAWLWWQDRTAADLTQQRLMDEITRLDRGDSDLALRLNELRQELETVEAADDGQALAAIQQRLQADRGRLAELEAMIEEQRTLARSLQGATDTMHGRLLALESALERLASPELDAARNLDLAEVDYLLRLANERLRLFDDLAAAEQALALADAHLDALDNPSYLGVRQEIAAARQALARVDLPDTVEIAAELDSVQARIPSLPLAGAGDADGEPAEAAGEGWWARLKSTLAGLVTVRRTSEDSMALSLQDKDYLRQRLWLQIEMSHLALMRRDQSGYRASLARAQETLQRWFDMSGDGPQSVRSTLEDLAALEVEADLPDISRPWNTLRLLRSSPAAGRPPPPSSGGSAAESEPFAESGNGNG